MSVFVPMYMRVHVHVCVLMWVYVHMHVCACMHVSVAAYACTCMYVYVCVRKCTCLYMQTHVFVCFFVCSCVYVLKWVHVHMHMCVCMYVCACDSLCAHEHVFMCLCWDTSVCVLCVCVCRHSCISPVTSGGQNCTALLPTLQLLHSPFPVCCNVPCSLEWVAQIFHLFSAFDQFINLCISHHLQSEAMLTRADSSAGLRV